MRLLACGSARGKIKVVRTRRWQWERKIRILWCDLQDLGMGGKGATEWMVQLDGWWRRTWERKCFPGGRLQVPFGA